MVGNSEKHEPFTELLRGLPSPAQSLILTVSHFAGEGTASKRLSHKKARQFHLQLPQSWEANENKSMAYSRSAEIHTSRDQAEPDEMKPTGHGCVFLCWGSKT